MVFFCIVKPNSKTESITATAKTSLRIKIKAQPVKGQANAYLEKYLADIFNLPRKNVSVIAGFTGSHKRVNIVADEIHIQKIVHKINLL